MTEGELFTSLSSVLSLKFTSLILVGNMVVRAPQARQMVARGEREARSPWNAFEKRSTGLEGRQKRARASVAPAGLARFLSVIQGQRVGAHEEV
jgi:hypothetical protein